MVGIMVSAEWGLRYDRRLNAITYECFSDTIAREALVARNRARDALVTDMPDGNAEILQALELSLSNWPGFDARSLKDPHGYGPSVRWLWGKQQGSSEEEIWRSIVDWARHRPEVWQAEDRRKKKGQAYTNPQLGSHLQRDLAWATTDDLSHPWQVKVDSSTWRVRLNNFPDDIMYTLIIDDQVVGDFHDWPECWQRILRKDMSPIQG